MEPIDGIREEFQSGPVVKFICPTCRESLVQPVRKEDDEGSLIGMLPHDGCEATEVLIRVK